MSSNQQSYLKDDIDKLIIEYGFDNLVCSLLAEDADRFFNARVLGHLARRARKESLQLVGLAPNCTDKRLWISQPIFRLNEEEKRKLSDVIRIYTYEQLLHGFFDPAVIDSNGEVRL